MLYYIGLVSAQNLGKAGEINSLLSVWIPNFILFIFAIYLAYKTQKEIPFSFLDRLINLMNSVTTFLARAFFKKSKQA